MPTRDTYLEWELNKPIRRSIRIDQIIQRIPRHAKGTIRSQTILDATRTCSRKGEFFHDALEQIFVNFLEHRQGIRGKLDGPSETSKGRGSLVHRHIKASVQHAKGRRQASDATAGNGHFEWTTRTGWQTQRFKRGIFVGYIGRVSHAQGRRRREGQ